MAISDIKGLDFLKNINIGAWIQKIGIVAFAVLTFFIVAIIIFFFLRRRKEKAKYDNILYWFEEVNGQMVPTGNNTAMEITIPGTNIKLFYCKDKDMYLPRGNKRMGLKSYWYCIRNNREIVNFSMKNLNKEMAESGLDYDHNDMRYAHENLRELIKRNYTDKSLPWWREYKDIIATAIFIFVLGIAFFFLLGKIGELIGKISPLLDTANEILKNANTLRTSGIINQGAL